MSVRLFRKSAAVTATALLVAAALAGCSTATKETTVQSTQSTTATVEEVIQSEDTVVPVAVADKSVADALAANLPYQEGDTSYDSASATKIDLANAVAADGVQVDGEAITITKPGTYIVSGTLADGTLAVNSPDEGVVKVVLDGANISSSTTSPLQVTDADSVVVILADGSSNELSDATTYVYPDAETTEPNAALYSTADMTIGGTGTLKVKGNSNDGITAKDGLVISGGTITVVAADDAIRGKDYLVVTGGTIDVDAGGDGLKSDNEEDATAGYVAILGGTISTLTGDDGITAFTDVIMGGGTMTIDSVGKGMVGDVSVIVGGEPVIAAKSTDDTIHTGQLVAIDGGKLELSSGDDGIHSDAEVNISGGAVTIAESEEGIEGGTILLSGGTVNLTAADDGINATNDTGSDILLEISGGEITVNSGGDGLDSNGRLVVSGGNTVVFGPTNEGNGPVDAESEFTVTGGTLLAVGSAGMAMAPGTASTQGWIGGVATAAAGATVSVVNADGTELTSVVLPKDSSSVVFSSADIITGETYTVNVDGTSTASLVAGTTTLSGMMGGPGGGMGGGPRG